MYPRWWKARRRRTAVEDKSEIYVKARETRSQALEESTNITEVE